MLSVALEGALSFNSSPRSPYVAGVGVLMEFAQNLSIAFTLSHWCDVDDIDSVSDLL